MRLPLFYLRLLLVLALLGAGRAAHATDFVRGRVYTRGGEAFQLLIDGHLMGPVSNNFPLATLPAGYHWLEFRFPNRRLPHRVTGYRIQAWFAPGFESVYELDAFPPRNRMVLTRVACPPLTNWQPAGQFQWPDAGIDPGYDPTYGPGYVPNYQPAPSTPAGNWGQQCANLLQPQDVNALVGSVQARDFENTKLSVAKQAVGSATILADDVARIMRLFEFENSRLEFAKFAYARCCDQRNYFRVNDAFEFESSVTSLQRFTQGGR